MLLGSVWVRGLICRCLLLSVVVSPQHTFSLFTMTHLLSLRISTWHGTIYHGVVSSCRGLLLGLAPLLGGGGGRGWRRPLIL
jgi:hypothetical protein